MDLKRITKIPIRLIDGENEERDRESDELLKASISLCGLLEPITVTRTSMGRYRVICGERRLAACKELGYETIDAVTVCDTEAGLMLRKAVGALSKGRDVFSAADKVRDFCIASSMSAENAATALGISGFELGGLLKLCTFNKKHREILTAAGVEKSRLFKIAALPESFRDEAVKAAAEEQKAPKNFHMKRTSDRRGDIRLFLNSFDRIVSAMQKAGYLAEVIERDRHGRYEYTVTVDENLQIPMPGLKNGTVK